MIYLPGCHFCEQLRGSFQFTDGYVRCAECRRLSEEERVEKERRAALKKAEKDAQLKAKKEAELKRKQEKSERKRVESATKQIVDPKLETVNYVPPTLVVEESKPLQKNDSKKQKKTEKKVSVEAPAPAPVEVKEEPVVRTQQTQQAQQIESKAEEKIDKKSKKNKQEKKKSESENRHDEVKLFEATATPKNTPFDTPKDAPTTPAEYDLDPPQPHHVDLTKAVDEKKKPQPEESSHKAEKVVVEEPVIEKIEQEAVKQEAPVTVDEVNGVHEAPFIVDEKEGMGELGEIGRESHSQISQILKDQPKENPNESHFKENLKDAGLGPVNHWKDADGEPEKVKEEEEPKEPKEGLLSSLAETVTNIWEDLTSSKPSGDEEKPVKPAEETKPDIWEEFTSGKPLFKEEVKDELPDIQVSDSSKVAEELSKEVEQIGSVAQPADISEEFTSGKPLLKEDVKEVEEEPAEISGKKKNKKNKGKSGKNQEAEQSKSTENPAVAEIKAEEPVDIWEEFTSGKPLFKEEVEPEEQKVKGNKEKTGKTSNETEVRLDQIKKGLLRTELKESVSEMSTASMDVNIPLNEDQDKFNATQPEIEINNRNPSKETQFVAFETKKNKKKEKRSKDENAPKQPLQPLQNEPESNENPSEKPIFDEKAEKTGETGEKSVQPLPEAHQAHLAESETQPHEVSYGTIQIASENKKNKKNRNKKGKTEILNKNDSSEGYELALEKDIFQKLKPSEKHKKSKSPEVEKVENVAFVWDGLVAGVPIIKAITSPKSSPKSSPKKEKQSTHSTSTEPRQSEEPKESKEGLLSSLAETVTNIWEDLTSGKPSGDEDKSVKPVEAEETNPDIWEEFTSGKPLFKEDAEIEEKVKEVKPTENVEAQPAEPIDIWEEFTSGKPLFKEEVKEEVKQVEEPAKSSGKKKNKKNKGKSEDGESEKVKEEEEVKEEPKEPKEPKEGLLSSLAETVTNIWEDLTSSKPLGDEDKPVKPAEPVEAEETKPDIWEEFTSGKPLFKDDVAEAEVLPKPVISSESEILMDAPSVSLSSNPPVSSPKANEDFSKDHGKKSKKDKKNKKIGEEKEKEKEVVEVKKEESKQSPKPIERVEEPVSIQIEEKKDKKKNKKEKKTSESQSQFSPDSGVVTEQHIDVEAEGEKVTATLKKTEPESPIKQEPKETKSKKDKKDKKHRKSESESQIQAEAVPVKENGQPVQEVPKVEEKKEPIGLKNAEPAEPVEPVETAESAQAEKSTEKKENKKKNKKGKTNSESEQVIEAKKSPSPVKEVKEVNELPKPVEAVLPETKVEPVSTPPPTNNGSSKNKKKNKGKHGKENGSPTIVEEKQAPISSEKIAPVEAADQNENLKPSPPAETEINRLNGNFADEHSFEEQKGKKGRKKNKSRSSESHELNGKLENAQVVTELNYDKDDLNKLGAESTSEQRGAAPQPVQVNEVTSTEATEGDQRVFRENIKAVYDIDPSVDPTAHPTQFAIQVQKLVESTLAASELKHADPNTKYSVQAQLLRLKEHDEQPKHTYTLRPLTPLAFERHVTVVEGQRSPYTPSPRERSYKLLPKDILFCSYMIHTYGEDYEGMTKDAKNVYRENARSLQRKMRVFKESPHFDTYKKAEETGRSVEEILQEEGVQA